MPTTAPALLLALDAPALRGGPIAGVTAFRTRDVYPRFGLPEQLPAGQER